MPVDLFQSKKSFQQAPQALWGTHDHNVHKTRLPMSDWPLSAVSFYAQRRGMTQKISRRTQVRRRLMQYYLSQSGMALACSYRRI